MGKPKKFTPEELEQKWQEYKSFCDNYTVPVTEFSSRNSEFVSMDLKKPITYTIEGFCVWLPLDRSSFYKNYRDCKRYAHIVSRMQEECEFDARRKFETGMIPTQLAGLWMSKHGYSTKAQTDVSGSDEAIRKFLGAVKPSPEELAKLYETDE